MTTSSSKLASNQANNVSPHPPIYQILLLDQMSIVIRPTMEESIFSQLTRHRMIDRLLNLTAADLQARETYSGSSKGAKNKARPEDGCRAAEGTNCCRIAAACPRPKLWLVEGEVSGRGERMQSPGPAVDAICGALGETILIAEQGPQDPQDPELRYLMSSEILASMVSFLVPTEKGILSNGCCDFCLVDRQNYRPADPTVRAQGNPFKLRAKARQSSAGPRSGGSSHCARQANGLSRCMQLQVEQRSRP
jgi:hypothetical protein